MMMQTSTVELVFLMSDSLIDTIEQMELAIVPILTTLMTVHL